MKIYLSPQETRRFGRVCLRCDDYDAGGWHELLDKARLLNANLITIRCSGRNIAIAQELEENGARLMDTLIQFQTSNLATLPKSHETIGIQVADTSHAGAIERIARSAFADYVNHYRADPRLPGAAVSDALPDWTLSFIRDPVPGRNELLIATIGGEVVGFAAMSRTDEIGEGVLHAVSPHARRRGVYRQLLIAGMHWSAEGGCHSFVVKTQLHNLAAQRGMCQVGLAPRQSWYTFHYWRPAEPPEVD